MEDMATLVVQLILVYLMTGMIFEVIYWYSPGEHGCIRYLIGAIIVLLWPAFILYLVIREKQR